MKGLADEMVEDVEGGVDSPDRVKLRWRRRVRLPAKRIYQTGTEVPVVEPTQGL